MVQLSSTTIIAAASLCITTAIAQATTIAVPPIQATSNGATVTSPTVTFISTSLPATTSSSIALATLGTTSTVSGGTSLTTGQMTTSTASTSTDTYTGNAATSTQKNDAVGSKGMEVGLAAWVGMVVMGML